MAKYEIKVEREYLLTLTGKEAVVLQKLLGELSCTIAEGDLGLTEEEYKITYDIYNAFE